MPTVAFEPIEVRTRAQWAAAVQASLGAAIARDARMIWCADPDFATWPLDEPTLIGALAAYLRRPQRRLGLLAADFDALARAHPRFAGWRVDWMPAIDARRPDDTLRSGLPTLLVDDGPVLLELWEREPLRGLACSDAAAARRARDALDTLWQRAEPAWPGRPLGL